MGMRLRALQASLRWIQSRPAAREPLLVEALYEARLADVLNTRRVDCVLDVGANRGQFARRLRTCGYAGRIVSFEPLPHLFDGLRKIADADGRWLVRPIALGGAAGIATLHASSHDDFSSFLRANDVARDEFGVARESWRDVDVEVRRLDDVIDELLPLLDAPRFFLKLDTQGYDLEVFAGLGRWQSRLAGLQSDLSLVPIYDGMPAMDTALRTYGSAGYDISGLFPVSVERSSGRVIEFDRILVRSDGAGDDDAPDERAAGH